MKIGKQSLILIFIIFLAAFLRFYKLSSNPPGLYWEEAALGYDAYSLLKTGKDHRGNPWPIVNINSYMDYKPPLYVYAAIPSVAIFGLSEFAVRLPSALAGTLTVIVVYFLVKELFLPPIPQPRRLKKKPPRFSLAAIAAFLLAVSPWHMQFSRAAFEANLALFLIVLAVWLFLKSFKIKVLLAFSSLFFSLSLYAYHGARIFAPLLVFYLALFFRKKLFKIRKSVIIAGIIGLIITFPLLSTFRNKEIKQRFQETSAFATLEPIIKSNNKIQQAGGGLLARLVYHRCWEYLRIFIDKYFQHFNGSYLFLYGDNNPRHSTQEFGLFYHWEAITLILGMTILLKNPKKENLLILSWLLLAVIPAAITKATPHALRTIFALPAYTIASAIGLVYLIQLIKTQKIIVLLFYCFIVFETISYLHFYHHHYPKIHSFHWQYGYKQAIEFVKTRESEFESIYLTDNYGRAYMYSLFYGQIDPVWLQEEIKPYKNTSEVLKIGKYHFGANAPSDGKNLYIVEPKSGAMTGKKLLKTIDFLNGQRAFEIWETE